MSSTSFSLTVLKYGESVLPESQVLLGGDPERPLPISFCIYMIEQGERRILVDAGCDTMPGFDMKHFCSPTELLLRMGLEPSDITDVIITHAHHDHIDGLRHFKNATVYIHKEALVKGARYIPQGCTVKTFTHTLEIIEGVRSLHVGGHAAGSCAVTICRNGRSLVIVGDECYTDACFARGIPTGVSRDPARSKAFLTDYAAWEKLYCHDPDILPDQNGFLKLL